MYFLIKKYIIFMYFQFLDKKYTFFSQAPHLLEVHLLLRLVLERQKTTCFCYAPNGLSFGFSFLKKR